MLSRLDKTLCILVQQLGVRAISTGTSWLAFRHRGWQLPLVVTGLHRPPVSRHPGKSSTPAGTTGINMQYQPAADGCFVRGSRVRRHAFSWSLLPALPEIEGFLLSFKSTCCSFSVPSFYTSFFFPTFVPHHYLVFLSFHRSLSLSLSLATSQISMR